MKEFVTILALIVGWGLNELSHSFRSSREHKEAIANAISVLLEIRFQVIGIDLVINELKKRGAPNEVMSSLRELIETCLPSSESLNLEYEDSINIVAKTDPILAYEYRSKNYFQNYISKWRSMASEQGASLKDIEEMESELSSMVIPNLNKVILHLAKIHSRKTLKEVNPILERKAELPKEFNSFLDRLNDKS